MDEATLASLPDAAFCAGRSFVHHTDSAQKPTENSSVDTDLLKEALAAVNGTDLPQADKQAALDHLKAHALALDFEDSEVADLIGDAVEPPDYATRIAEAASFVEAEDLLVQLVEAKADEELVALAHDRYIEFANVDREAFADEYDGSLVDAPKQGEDGLWHFTARVAQADKVNKNKRLYPKEEFEKNLARVNRLCKAGRFTGRDGHSSMFGDDKPSEICVRYDAVMLQGSDLIVDGTIVPTQAGQNLVTLWENGVQFEWSIVSYGIPDYQNDDKGNFTHAVIRELVWDGCDPVRRGAASTRTMKITKPKDSVDSNVAPEEGADEIEDEVQPEASPEETHMGEEVKDEKTVEEPVAEAPKTDTIDVDAIVKAAVEAAGKNAATVAADAAVKAAQAFHDAQQKAQALQAAKDAAIAVLVESDKDLATIVARHFDDCEDAEAVAATVTAITPQVQSMKKRMEMRTIGIHTKSEKEIGWFNGTAMVDRPESTYEVKEGLLSGLEDTGEQSPANKHWAFSKVLDNYEKMHPEYFHACTRRGYLETATTSTALGTTLPVVLPMIRQIFPKLISYEIQSVQPLQGPTGRVYFLDFTYGSGDNVGSGMDDSGLFDTSWADHTEGETKSQQSFAITHTDVEAAEKSIYYDITSIVMQDMKALYNLDAEAELLQAGANEIARELNLQYLQTIAVGAGINAGTYGYTKPTNWDSQEKWYDQGFSMWVNHAGAEIGKKFYTEAQWCFCGPTQAKLFASSLHWEASKSDPNEFGYGVKRAGTYDGQLTVYSVSWGEAASAIKNKLTFGFYPEDWMHTGSVFAPYIPLYVSPQDSNASKNTLSRSVSSRNAMKVLQPNAFSQLTISSATGTEVPFTD